MLPVREADYSSPTGTKGKNAPSYTPPPLSLVPSGAVIKQRDNIPCILQ